jgi:tetratricopeptide (TPR) repeat protein
VEKFIGDAVVGVFGVPLAHEDDPERAVRAALKICADVEASDLGIEVRIGVNTGEALVRLDLDPRSGVGFATGDTMNTTARLEAAAPVMGVAVSERTHAATEAAIAYEELPPVQAKGKAEPLAAFRALEPISRVHDERDATPFVGRELELGVLTQLFERSRTRPATEFATVVADPGLGKSRLVRELWGYVESVPELVRWRVGRCLPYGEGIGFWALGEVVKAEAGILDSDDQPTLKAKLEAAVTESDEQTKAWMIDRLAPLVGLETRTQAPEKQEAFTAWRRFLESLASQGPTVFVIEDLHWADPGFVAFLEHLTERTAGVPLLVVVTARPEVEERHPSWPPGRRSTLLALSPLGDADVEALIRTSLPDPSDELIRVVLERAGGSPLYAEQLAAMLHDRALPIAGGAIDGTLIPQGVQALIAARIDALAPEAKQVLMQASVVGKTFWAGAVASLGEHPDLDGTLGELVRREFCRPQHPSTIEGDREFGFWHALVRDVAYAELTKAERATMHESFADWLGDRADAGASELGEILAHHLETAIRLQPSASEGDQRIAGLASRAASALATSGRRAHSRGDMAATRSLLRRAIDLWPADDIDWLDLVPELADALNESGDEGSAISLLDESITVAREAGETRILAHLTLARREFSEEEPWAELAEEEAQAAIRVFSDHGDERGLAEAWRRLGFVAWHRGQVGAAEQAWQRVIQHANRSGDPAASAIDRAWLLTALDFGPTPAGQAMEIAREAYEAEEMAVAKTQMLWTIAILQAMNGDFDAARASFRRSSEIERELGREYYATHFATQVESEIERLASAFERQARVLRDGLDRWEAAFGETNAMLTAMLALALAESELDAEAAN